MGVRPGYELVDSTAIPALLVLTKGGVLPSDVNIPQQIGDVRVRVQPADPEEQLLGGAGILAYWTKLLAGSRSRERRSCSQNQLHASHGCPA